MVDKTPQKHSVAFPVLPVRLSSLCGVFSSVSPVMPWIFIFTPCCTQLLRIPDNSSLLTSKTTSHQEPLGPPEFYGVSLSAYHGLWTPTDLHIQAIMDDLVLPSVCVKTLGIRDYSFRSCTSTSGCASPLRSTEFPVYASPALFTGLSADSATGATLGTGGWLSLTRRGLSPC